MTRAGPGNVCAVRWVDNYVDHAELHPSGITGDTLPGMAEVSIRDLRNHGGDVVERAQRGERLTITRAGKPVAQLTALRRAPVPLDELMQRWAPLPEVDPAMLRRDIDAVIDASI